MSSIRIITLVEIEAVHADLVSLAARGIFSAPLGPFTGAARSGSGAIISSIHPLFGQDKYPTVALKAARLLYGGTTTQYLIDGNKRLATAVMEEQLAINGYELDVADEELTAFVVIVATSGGTDFEETVFQAGDWIDARLTTRRSV